MARVEAAEAVPPQLRPPSNLSLPAASLWLVTALRRHGHFPDESLAIAARLMMLKGDAGALAAVELFLSDGDVDEFLGSVRLLSTPVPPPGATPATASSPAATTGWRPLPATWEAEDSGTDGSECSGHIVEEREPEVAAVAASAAAVGEAAGAAEGAGGAGGAAPETTASSLELSEMARGDGRLPEGSIILYCAKEMEDIARETAAMSRGRIVPRKIHWLRFKDGFPNLFIEHVKAMRAHQVAFLASFHDTAAIFEQLAAIGALPRFLARSFLCFVPWYPTGTMERSSKLGEVATAHTLARLLSATPHSSSGPSKLCIFDIHTLGQRFYFTDNVLIRLKSCTHLLERLLRKRYSVDDVRIVFPDEGAWKRFKTKFTRYRMIICSKVRDGDARIVTVTEGLEYIDKDDPAARYVIVDDLVQTGGTLLQCATALRSAGAEKVSCYCTHGVFPQESWKRFVDNPLIDKFYITDTIPTTAKAVRGVAPFEVLSIAPILCTVMLGTATSPATA